LLLLVAVEGLIRYSMIRFRVAAVGLVVLEQEPHLQLLPEPLTQLRLAQVELLQQVQILMAVILCFQP
jgi:hypothetical protein